MSATIEPDQEVDLEELKVLDAIAGELPAVSRDVHQLIPVLQQIQQVHGYLPRDSMKMVAAHFEITAAKVFGIATFYNQFRFNPPGRHPIKVCLGTACHVRGGREVAEELERQLQIKPGQTTTDNEFTLETVNCLGACALGPIVVLDGRYFSKVSPARVKQIIKSARAGKEEHTADGHVFPVKVSCPRCNHSLMDFSHQIDGHSSVRMTMAFGGKHGWLRLSSLYGSFNLESEYDIPLDTVVNLFCPHCHAELVGASRCPTCDAPMIPMLVDGGGVIQICTRRGCKEHRLDLVGVNL